MRKELTFRVKFYGKVEKTENKDGSYRFDWIDTEDVLATAYDVPVPGYKNETVNNLRLWQAKCSIFCSVPTLGNIVASSLLQWGNMSIQP